MIDKFVFLIFTMLLSILTLLFLSCNDAKESNPIENFVFNTPAQGCASFNVFRYSDNGLAAISVSGNRDNLGLTLNNQTFDISSDVTIELLEFDGNVDSHYCDDVLTIEDPSIIKTWNWESGNVQIQILEDSVFVSEWEMHYRIKVELVSIVLIDEAGEQTNIDMIFDDVLVGWLPG